MRHRFLLACCCHFASSTFASVGAVPTAWTSPHSRKDQGHPQQLPHPSPHVVFFFWKAPFSWQWRPSHPSRLLFCSQLARSRSQVHSQCLRAVCKASSFSVAAFLILLPHITTRSNHLALSFFSSFRDRQLQNPSPPLPHRLQNLPCNAWQLLVPRSLRCRLEPPGYLHQSHSRHLATQCIRGDSSISKQEDGRDGLERFRHTPFNLCPPLVLQITAQHPQNRPGKFDVPVHTEAFERTHGDVETLSFSRSLSLLSSFVLFLFSIGSLCVHTALTCQSVRVRGPWPIPCWSNMFASCTKQLSWFNCASLVPLGMKWACICARNGCCVCV